MWRLRGITQDLVRARLFLISYVPLWLMVVCRTAPSLRQHWDGQATVVLIFAILAIWGVIDAIRLINGSRKTSPRSVMFGEISDQGGNAAGYLATYLLPFIGLIPANWGDWLAYGVYAVVAMIVFIRTDLTFVNPTLYLLRHRVVSANAYLPRDGSLIAGSPFVVVCHDPRALASSEVVDVTSVGGGFVTKNEPDVTRGRAQQRSEPRGSGGDLSARGYEGRVEGD